MIAHKIGEELEKARSSYPRVSDIISKQTEREMRSIPMDVLANASIRGTKVHEYCIAFSQGFWIPEIEPELKPYVDAFIEWSNENVEKYLYGQTRLYDDEKRFSGEFDIIAILKDSKQIALLDLKTSAKTSNFWPIQLAAYKHLCTLNGYSVDSVYNIHLKKQLKKPSKKEHELEVSRSFNVKVSVIPYPDLTVYWEIFSSALRCYDFFDRKLEVFHDTL